MKPKDVKISTGPDAGGSLGIVEATRFIPYSKNSMNELQSLTFAAEAETLQARALELGATAVVGVSIQVNNLPGGLYVIATGTATK